MNKKRKESLAGRLTKRVDIEKPVRTSDGGGGFTESWQLVATVWAGLEPLRGSEDYSDLRLIGKTNYRITIRHRDGIEPRMRVNFNNRTFNIRAVLNLDEANEILELIAEEGVAT
jgi:SPP1 family predicted phage head-tail adaptor